MLKNIGRKLKEIGWSGKDFFKFLFPTNEEEEEEEGKTRVKVRLYGGTYGCMRVEPIYANSYRDCPSSHIIPFSQRNPRNIQNGGIIFDFLPSSVLFFSKIISKLLKEDRKRISFRTIFHKRDFLTINAFCESSRRRNEILITLDNNWINLVRLRF